MSANDASSDLPVDTSLPVPPPDDQAIAPPPTDHNAPTTASGGRVGVPPSWTPQAGVPDRTLTHKPRWPHPNFWWSILWCIFFMLVTQIPGAIVAVVVVAALAVISPQSFPRGALNDQAALLKSEPMSVGLAVAFFITELLVIGFSLLVIRLVIGRDWRRQLALRRPSLSHALLALASFPSLVLLGNLAYDVLRNRLHVPSLSDYGMSGMEEMVQVFSNWPAAFAVLVIGFGPGIGEELWCRGFLGRGLVGNYGVVFGVLASSFFFGLIHLDPCQGSMAVIMGLWLHFVYLTTRSLWLPMLLHTLNNSFAVIASRIPGLEKLDEPTSLPVLVLVTSALLLAAVAYALYQSRSRLAAQGPDTLFIWRPAFDGVEYPPPDRGTKVVHPALSVGAFVAAVGGFLLFVATCVALFAV
jgi:membrane protease YdiL (CAAX protease family)